MTRLIYSVSIIFLLLGCKKEHIEVAEYYDPVSEKGIDSIRINNSKFLIYCSRKLYLFRNDFKIDSVLYCFTSFDDSKKKSYYYDRVGGIYSLNNDYIVINVGLNYDLGILNRITGKFKFIEVPQKVMLLKNTFIKKSPISINDILYFFKNPAYNDSCVIYTINLKDDSEIPICRSGYSAIPDKYGNLYYHTVLPGDQSSTFIVEETDGKVDKFKWLNYCWLGHNDKVYGTDGNTLVTCFENSNFYRFDVTNGKVIKKYLGNIPFNLNISVTLGCVMANKTVFISEKHQLIIEVSDEVKYFKTQDLDFNYSRVLNIDYDDKFIYFIALNNALNKYVLYEVDLNTYKVSINKV